jgi:hypothetical protein
MRLSFAVLLVAGVLSASTRSDVLLAAASAQNQASGPAASASPNMPGMMAMMKMHDQMMTEMKANDAKLDALLKDVNGAKGEARIDAVVAAVNELARQHKAERAHMNEMHQMMMGGHGSQESAPTAGHAH